MNETAFRINKTKDQNKKTDLKIKETAFKINETAFRINKTKDQNKRS